MRFFYSFVILAARCVVPLVARSTKAKAFLQGRKEVWKQLESIPKNAKVVWMHCASLGEYEQGLPVLEGLKAFNPDYFYLVTFFSPSGYEVRSTHGVADLATYLPWDTKKEVQRFVSRVNPKMALFVKYEFWPNMIAALHNTQVPLYLIAGQFRAQQVFFKPWGSSYRKLLKGFKYLFVQNEQSLKLLQQIGITHASVSGDTRYDRVGASKAPLPFMETFVGNRKCIVAGSTWPEDEAVLFNAIAQTPDNWCWLIAPHEMNEEKLNKLMAKLPKASLRYSQTNELERKDCPVLVLDTVGMLSRCYAYGAIAYVGGGMGTSGLHNILEPAAEGIPVIIGKNYHKFPEAKALIDFGGVISISTADDCNKKIIELTQNDTLRAERGNLNAAFVSENQGATEKTLIVLNQAL
ncbi:MAG: 3-deoxy-D-manno-octulosonic acid transferase [Bacteroidetes bacterium]|nr:3-deoxy-D-manno-octulosonic acid transferase [Bacteroidota bacterium]MDA0888783.1 3-deoxy-D-manno-octulosonic acid transferase [Bacteroidota bacterium]MDA1084545.1 3-deoxy-D-manno-octulosonic acid transferase [Bacteroidota bacterium]